MTTIERRRSWPSDLLRDESDAWFPALRDLFAGRTLLGGLEGSKAIPLQVEEFVEDGKAVIRVEMPGIDPDKDVEVKVADGVLHVKASREEREESKLPSGYRSEFRYGSFQRSIRLPEGVTESEVKATYKDGILEVRVPMPPAAEPQKPEPVSIPVERA